MWRERTRFGITVFAAACIAGMVRLSAQPVPPRPTPTPKPKPTAIPWTPPPPSPTTPPAPTPTATRSPAPTAAPPATPKPGAIATPQPTPGKFLCPPWITLSMRPDTSALAVLMEHPPMLKLDLDTALPLVECAGSICFTDGRKAELWIRVGTGDARRYVLAPAP